MQSLSFRHKLLLAVPAALLASLASGQLPERNAGQLVTVDVDPEKQVTEACLECHLEMHGNPMEIEGEGLKVRQCASCHQWLHQRPVRIRTQDARITFRRPTGDFEAGKTYEGQLATKQSTIYMFPERHLRTSPGRCTGLRFVKEDGEYVFFTVFLQGGLTLEDVEISFVPMEFQAGESKATVAPADVAEMWFKGPGGYASLEDYERTYSPVDSGPAGGGVKPLAFTDYDIPARFGDPARGAPPGEAVAGRPRAAQPRPGARREAAPLGQVVFTYNLEKARPYHFVSRPDGQIVAAGSNQIALWIEDKDLRCVDTIFVTRLAGRKGYRFNLATLPMWRKTSRWDLVSREEADAVSGPTQKPGAKSLLWDCRDWQGEAVEPGTYTYRLEANLMMANRALWSGQIEVGSQRQSSTAALLRIPAGNTAHLIVTDVKATFEPCRR